MNVKKILSIFTVTMVFSSFCQFPVKANAESNNADTVIHGTGAKWEIFCDDYGFSGSNIDGDVIVENIGNRTLPSSYDISINSATAQYFPPIGDQGAIGSCAAFATTYYQFTYEANKLKNEATVSSNIYSPRWTYNYINGGHDDGASLKDAYLVLKNQGAMYNADWTYNGNSASYSFAWPENLPKMREALTYRSKVSNKYVSSSNLDNINTIKSEIASGKVGVICTKSSGWATRYKRESPYGQKQKKSQKRLENRRNCSWNIPCDRFDIIHNIRCPERFPEVSIQLNNKAEPLQIAGAFILISKTYAFLFLLKAETVAVH